MDGKDTISIMWIFALILIINLPITSATVIRVVTWNVKDNSMMDDGYTDSTMDKVLGLNNGNLADIYAIGLQENCWECNEGSFYKIGNKFLGRINRKSSSYEVIGIEGTRESIWCEFNCRFNTHGSTILVIIAKKELVISYDAFHRNDDCSSKFPQNDEKGIAAGKLVLSDRKTVCFGNGHLDSKKPDTRRECLKLYFEDVKRKWKSFCDYQFLFGDLNTRTGDKMKNKPDSGKSLSPSDPILNRLKKKDEFRGEDPYGKTSSWGRNLLSYINNVQSSTFIEPQLRFMPTYSVRPSNECGGSKHCYKQSRPISWTDRIILTKGEVVEYGSIEEIYGDHFPVYGVFRLN